MSNATKCDRCGACYEYGGMTVGEEYDLCDGCVADFEAWMERGHMADTSERATESAEMAHDTGEKLEAAAQTAAGYIYGRGFTNGLADAWNDDEVDTAANQIIQLLDRQAAITERECMERTTSERIGFDCAECVEGLGRELEARCYHLKARIAELRAERDEWKTKCETREFAYKQADAERKRYSEQIDELLAERNEWNGLAEKYRADSIAAQAETERYRAKLGDVLDALHEAERAVR